MFKCFKEKSSELMPYTVTLQRRNEEQTAYTVTSVFANSPDDAAKIAKKFIAENGIWAACLNTSERMSCLNTVEIIPEA